MEMDELLTRTNWDLLDKLNIYKKEYKDKFDVSVPELILIYMRLLIENINRYLYERHFNNIPPRMGDFLLKIININEKNSIIPSKVKHWMHHIRIISNDAAAHPKYSKKDLKELAESLEADFILTFKWFLEEPIPRITGRKGLLDDLTDDQEKEKYKDDPILELRMKWKREFEWTSKGFDRSSFIQPTIRHFKDDHESDIEQFQTHDIDQEKAPITYEQFKHFFIDLLEKGKLLLLLGEAGLGKSTFLEGLKYDLLHEEKNNILPVLIKFSEFPSEHLNTAQLYELFYKICWPNKGEIYNEAFYKALHSGKVVFLLDGLDEYFIRLKADMGLISDWLDILTQFAENYETQIIITSRSTIWTRRSLITLRTSKEIVYELIKWNEHMIKTWITRNYERWIKKEDFSDTFIFNKLKQIYSVYQLCSTPFLLTCCVENFKNFIKPRSEGEVLNRTEVYKYIVNSQIKKNTRRIDTALEIDNNLLLKIFRHIAIEYLHNRSANISLENLNFTQVDFINEVEAQIINKARQKYEDEFYTLFRNHSFLNLNSAKGLIFAHQTFAEYLVAEIVYSYLNQRLLNQNQDQPLQYFSVKYFTLETLRFFIEMVNLMEKRSSKTLIIADFIKFLSEECSMYVTERLLHWLNNFYDDSNKLREDLLELVQQGLNNQKELSLSFKGKKAPRIIQYFWEEEIFNIVLQNKKLVRLILKGAPFQAIPDGIFDLNNLEELYLDNWENLKQISESIAKLKNLKILSIENSKMNSLPESIGKLNNLVELVLNKNKLKSLPESIGLLKDLKALSVRSNNLDSLPESIKTLKNLQILNLSENNLNSLPSELGELQNLEKLNLKNNQLESLPREIGNLDKLSLLNLSDNQLSSFFPHIFNLINLEKLYFDRNNIHQIPNQINNLKQLESLSLNNNGIIELNVAIGDLNKLKTLNLIGNKLSSTLPKEIGSALRKLEDQGCKIKGVTSKF